MLKKLFKNFSLTGDIAHSFPLSINSLSLLSTLYFCQNHNPNLKIHQNKIQNSRQLVLHSFFYPPLPKNPPKKMENQVWKKSTFPKTKSSMIDDYFKQLSSTKQMKNLPFPNSHSENLSKKSVYRPAKKSKKHSKLKKSSTSLIVSHSNKSIEIPSSPKTHDKTNDFDNLSINHEITQPPKISKKKNNASIHDSQKIPEESRAQRKYSWEDVKNWIPPSERKTRRINECKIKYSWEIIGVESQTSETLIEDFKKLTELKDANCPRIKYSWEVIGTGNQTSLHDLTIDSDYWVGRVVIGSGKNITRACNSSRYYESNKIRFVCNTGTQCTADKGVYADLMDCTVKYSWQNLTKAYNIK